MLEGMQREYDMIDDGSKLGPIEVYNVLERIMYNRRYFLDFIKFYFERSAFDFILDLEIIHTGILWLSVATMSMLMNHSSDKLTLRLVILPSHVYELTNFRAHHSKQNLSVLVSVDFWSVH